MRGAEFRQTRSRRLFAALIASFLVVAAQPAAALKFETVYEFGAVAKNGAKPWDTVITDGKGNLYGTTSGGGKFGGGAVFELSPPGVAGGKWTESLLYSFGGNSEDGVGPRARLVMGPAGDLFGTTAFGGAYYSSGTIFELLPPKVAGGKWTEKILHSFGQYPTDGLVPVIDGLTLDAKSNLYGATSGGGANSLGPPDELCPTGCGTVYEVSPPATPEGEWTERLIHSFGATVGGGLGPESGFIADADGNLYGVTRGGGAYGTLTNGGGGGTVFELKTPAKPGEGWTETVIASFALCNTCTNGQPPYGRLAFDASGNLYGSTLYGGSGTDGTIFQSLRPTKAGGQWTTTTIHNFFGPPYDGEEVWGGLVVDAKDNVFGASQGGGAHSYGSVFELAPPKTKGGTWTFSFVHSFGSYDGAYPSGGLLMTPAGDLLGTTTDSGPYCDCGTVFELTP